MWVKAFQKLQLFIAGIFFLKSHTYSVALNLCKNLSLWIGDCRCLQELIFCDWERLGFLEGINLSTCMQSKYT